MINIKTKNILLDENGNIRLSDFGFAKYVEHYTSQLLRSCVGSPLYMAPQLLAREAYTTKCDIWSLGIILYEMLFQTVPWLGKDEQELLSNIKSKPLRAWNAA